MLPVLDSISNPLMALNKRLYVSLPKEEFSVIYEYALPNNLGTITKRRADIAVIRKDDGSISAVFEYKPFISELTKEQAREEYAATLSDVKMKAYILTDAESFCSLNFKTGYFKKISFNAILSLILDGNIDTIRELLFPSIIEIRKFFINALPNGITTRDEYLSVIKGFTSEMFMVDKTKPNTPSISFKDATLEDSFFKKILRTEDYHSLCRFGSLKRAFSLLEEKKQGMCCLACMNDRGEGQYVDEHIMSIQRTSPSSVDDKNRCFILSCMEDELEDNLTMWRLYGDDAKGVNYVYRVIPEAIGDFFIGRVSYQQPDGSHPELDYIANLLNKTFKDWHLSLPRWEIWKHFFKSHHFSTEKEVRLLKLISEEELDKMDYKWIQNADNGIPSRMIQYDIEKSGTFPLQLERVRIGPKNNEPSYLAEQFGIMARNRLNYPVDFVESEVKVYR